MANSMIHFLTHERVPKELNSAIRDIKKGSSNIKPKQETKKQYLKGAWLLFLVSAFAVLAYWLF